MERERPGTLSSGTAPSVSYIPPTTTLANPQRVTVTATSVADPTKSASLQITVNPYLVMPFQTLTDGTTGMPYSQAITLIGGTAPFSGAFTTDRLKPDREWAARCRMG